MSGVRTFRSSRAAARLGIEEFAASILEVEADRFAWSLVGTVAAVAAFVDEVQPLRDSAGVREPDVARVIATASSSLARRLMV